MQDGGDQNQAQHTDKNLKDRYLLDPTINRNSQLLLIKSLPFQSQGNSSHGNNRKEASTSAVNLVLSWDRRRISLCICSANRLHPTERFWLFPAPPNVPRRPVLQPRPWSVPSRAWGSGTLLGRTGAGRSGCSAPAGTGTTLLSHNTPSSCRTGVEKPCSVCFAERHIHELHCARAKSSWLKRVL